MTDDLQRRLSAPPSSSVGLDVAQLRAALARRAAADGLLDVAYGTYDSPLGPLTVFVTPHGLDDYFGGSRRDFELPIDWRLLRGFRADVLRATSRIPFGSVISYRDVAAAAGSPNAYRAAGNALGSNPIPIVVPCHRVLHSGGGLGGYTGGLERKRFLLDLEGAPRVG